VRGGEREYATVKPQNVAITGATGMIGTALTAALRAEGRGVTALTRDAGLARRVLPGAGSPDLRVAAYDPLGGDALRAGVEGCDAVVHLAGEPIVGRWTPDTRRAIGQSRADGTRRLVAAIAAARDRPRVLVSASAARFYGVSDTAIFDEDSPPGPAWDFLATVCRAWEREALAAEALGVRVVILRFGVVLGLTRRMREVLPSVRRFIGGRVGSGRQWLSWLHLSDAVAVIERALDDETMRGPYNATAPTPVPMAQFTAALGRAAGGVIPVPVPTGIIQRYMGDGATVILDGQRALPKRLIAAGHQFLEPDIARAAARVLA